MASTTFSNAPARSRSGYMYFWLATVCAVFAFGAFAATYWLQLAAGTLVGASPLMHLHAALFSAWTLLLVSQTWLAARGRLDHHRAWGLAGIALASAMVVVGMALAIRSEADYLARGYGQAAVAFMIFPLAAIGEFALFFSLAIVNIARSDWHKRFMIVATAALLEAAAGRVGFLVATHGGGPGMRPGLSPPPPIGGMLESALMVSTVLVAGMLWDWRTTRRTHPAWVIGFVSIIGVGALSPAITASAPWAGLVSWIMGFGK